MPSTWSFNKKTFSASKKTPSVCDKKTTRLALDTREGDGRHHTSHHGPASWRVGCMGSCQGRVGCVTQQAVAMTTYTSIASGPNGLKFFLNLLKQKHKMGTSYKYLTILYYFDLFCLYTSRSFRNVLLTSRLIFGFSV